MRKSVKIGMTTLVIIILLIGGSVFWYFHTASGERALKNFESNSTGGLQRTVKVYSDSGKLLKEYKGRIDIKDTEYGNKVLFDLNGKRIVIYNATVVVEEK